MCTKFDIYVFMEKKIIITTFYFHNICFPSYPKKPFMLASYMLATKLA
jgi:hypothetical protein